LNDFINTKEIFLQIKSKTKTIGRMKEGEDEEREKKRYGAYLIDDNFHFLYSETCLVKHRKGTN